MSLHAPTSPRPFADAAIAAFPFRLREQAGQMAQGLSAFVDDTYRAQSLRMELSGEFVLIPYRFHFVADPLANDAYQRSPLAVCLCSRSTDGHLRQKAIRSILGLNEAWVIPFIAITIGEYVVEIIDDVRQSLSAMDRTVWADFVQENRPIMRLLRSRSVSYWSCYYQTAYPDREDYPGLVVLKQLETWAS